MMLNPKDEFEAAIMEIVATHREKAKYYGSERDSMQNFYNIAGITFCGPLQACEVLMAKHGSVIKDWVGSENESNPYTDDAYNDRAVYGVLAKVLYKRHKAQEVEDALAAS